jgi:3-deoxy-7-phosphoheptulonate synthase
MLVIKPNELINEFPLTVNMGRLINNARCTISKIIQGQDKRLLVIVGPCSIHDTQAALEYAECLKTAAAHFSDELYFVMRVYFEKPRTTIGWTGLINDPFLNASYDINYGLRLARKLLLDINYLGLPAGTEFLNPATPQYLSDLISWSAIGARTVESQIHRELASGLSMPVGFKNNTDGNIKIAIDAANVARQSHHLININHHGQLATFQTNGNPDTHIILRGSNTIPNYSAEDVKKSVNLLRESQLSPYLIIDCSHGNSMKDHQRQKIVIDAIAEQISNGIAFIAGIMLESNLVAGKQELDQQQALVYGKSITDACIDWNDTLLLLEKLALAVKTRNKSNKSHTDSI